MSLKIKLNFTLTPQVSFKRKALFYLTPQVSRSSTLGSQVAPGSRVVPSCYGKTCMAALKDGPPVVDELARKEHVPVRTALAIAFSESCHHY